MRVWVVCVGVGGAGGRVARLIEGVAVGAHRVACAGARRGHERSVRSAGDQKRVEALGTCPVRRLVAIKSREGRCNSCGCVC